MTDKRKDFYERLQVDCGAYIDDANCLNHNTNKKVDCEFCRIEFVRKKALKEFAEKVKQAICDNTVPYFNKDGKPCSIWNTNGFDRIDEILKELQNER